MSDERENQQVGATDQPHSAPAAAADEGPLFAGAPVEQADPTETQVLAAVERASDVAGSESSAADVVEMQPASDDSAVVAGAPERPKIPAFLEPPSANGGESAEEIFAAGAAGAAAASRSGIDAPVSPETPVVPETVIPPAAPPAEPTAPVALPPVRDGEIRIPADHPMADLYRQTPIAPEMRGNRGAGVLIAAVATIAFAVVYAGVLALWQAPNFPPSRFLDEGLLPWVMNWGFVAAVVGFFVALTILVLVVGRAGWWAYVVFGLLVAAGAWASTLYGYALVARLAGEQVSLHPFVLMVEHGLFFPVIAAGLVAREVVVWFGAWIGARGRRVKRANAEAIIEHEKALAEAQAKLS